jgi:hypothetical protein
MTQMMKVITLHAPLETRRTEGREARKAPLGPQDRKEIQAPPGVQDRGATQDRQEIVGDKVLPDHQGPQETPADQEPVELSMALKIANGHPGPSSRRRSKLLSSLLLMARLSRSTSGWKKETTTTPMATKRDSRML